MTGPNTGKFIARTGNHSWADFDAEHDWQDQAGEKFEELVAPHIEKMNVEYTEEMAFSMNSASLDDVTRSM